MLLLKKKPCVTLRGNMYNLKHIGMVIFTVVLMIGSYFLIKDLIGLATPFAIFILFVDEMILLILGMIGWKVGDLKDKFKR